MFKVFTSPSGRSLWFRRLSLFWVFCFFLTLAAVLGTLLLSFASTGLRPCSGLKSCCWGTSSAAPLVPRGTVFSVLQPAGTQSRRLFMSYWELSALLTPQIQGQEGFSQLVPHLCQTREKEWDLVWSSIMSFQYSPPGSCSFSKTPRFHRA